MRLIDLTGQRFGRLTVIERALDRDDKVYWLCRCECGVSVEASRSNLRAGRTTSCGTHCVNAAGRLPWPVDPRFLVGADGSIVGPKGRLLTPHFSEGNDYPTITVFRGGEWWKRPVHIIVCETFHGPRPDGQVVRHLDGNPCNSTARNLAWGTSEQNEADKLEHGRRLQGERHHQHKLTEDDVRAIRASSESSSSLAARYPVGIAAIRAVRRRTTWRHVA